MSSPSEGASSTGMAGTPVSAGGVREALVARLGGAAPGAEPGMFWLAGDALALGDDEPAQPLRVLHRAPGGLWTVQHGLRIFSGVVRSGAERGTLELLVNGRPLTLRVRSQALDTMEQRGGSGTATNGGLTITSPIPGTIKAVRVEAGAAVVAGQILVVLEAMKMENEIAAPHDGRVATLHVNPGQVVPAGAPLVALKV